ncbi:2'-5' RNA ligase family protein [Altererythrobacter sp.]|uniref:2'-5' RNA ligase family protein n=1 Tax=Altererythrobacter sp. TaxID=1872480 RepID=UPI003D01FC4B
MADPFIVTASLPPDIFAWADGLRHAHFPPERNKLQAHVTLFHSFAPSLFDELKTVLPGFAAEYAPPEGRVDGLMDLGKGTAIALRSPQLLAIREQIEAHFHGALTQQDRYEPRLHITIQNKVTKEEARELQRELAPQIEPRAFHFTGLELHIYRGGTWEHVRRFAFRGRAVA